jgi:hypothetical protein
LALQKATPRFPKWEGEFPYSTYGNKPILNSHGEGLYAEIVIVRLLEDEGWRAVWVNHVHRGPFPKRWTPPPPVKLHPPSDVLDLLDRIYDRSGERSGVFDVLAWAGESVLFAEAKHSGKDALRPSQKIWIDAAMDEGVPLEALLVVEWEFEGAGGYPNRDIRRSPSQHTDSRLPTENTIRSLSVDEVTRQVEVVTSEVSLRDGTESERTFRFAGELLATYALENREETLYKMDGGGFLICTHVKSPVGLSHRSLSHDVGRERGYTAEEVSRRHPKLGKVLGIPSSHKKMPGRLRIHKGWSDTQAPQGRMIISDDDTVTHTREVTLHLYADDHFGTGVVQMRLKNGGGDPWGKWVPYADTTSWKLSAGEGEKAIYVQFMDCAGNRSEPVKGTIAFRPTVR